MGSIRCFEGHSLIDHQFYKSDFHSQHLIKIYHHLFFASDSISLRTMTLMCCCIKMGSQFPPTKRQESVGMNSVSLHQFNLWGGNTLSRKTILGRTCRSDYSLLGGCTICAISRCKMLLRHTAYSSCRRQSEPINLLITEK